MSGGPPPAPRHGGDVYAAAQRWGLSPEALLDFSANLSPFGPPAGALRAVRAGLDMVRHYPAPLAPSLRAELARRWQVPADNLAVGNGAAELIYLVARLAAGRRALIPQPSFGEYARAVAASGGKAQDWPLQRQRGFLPDLDRLASDLDQVSLVLLCNPHNPSGAWLSPAGIVALTNSTPAYVVVDEAFIDFAPDGEAGSVIRAVPGRGNLIVLRSLTKFYALPGLRVGAVVAPAELIAGWDATRDVWSVSALAQAGALAALADAAHARRVLAWILRERPYLLRALAMVPGLTALPSAANFVLCRSPLPAWQLQERLGPLGILIRDCRSFTGLDAYDFRLSVRRRDENQRLIAALRQVLS